MVNNSSNSDAQKEDQILNEQFYQGIENVRRLEANKLSSELCVIVNRDCLYEDMIKLYQKRNTVTSKLLISFVDEDSIGDGVAKDAYSRFFQSMYEKFDGCSSKKVPSTSVDDEELRVIGKLNTHAFITYGVLLLQIYSSTMKYYLQDEIEDKEILSSFLNFLPSNETQLIKTFKEIGGDTQPISDILSDYSIFSVPTKDSIDELTVKAGKVALIRNPCFAIQHLVNGMGTFWNKCSKSHIDSIYSITLPNAERIINCLDSTENSKQEGKILTWFHRYIRSCSLSELIRLVRFITGSPSLSPSAVIKVEFVDQSVNNLRPQAQTCFKFFIIPRQYYSFSQLRQS